MVSGSFSVCLLALFLFCSSVSGKAPFLPEAAVVTRRSVEALVITDCSQSTCNYSAPSHVDGIHAVCAVFNHTSYYLVPSPADKLSNFTCGHLFDKNNTFYKDRVIYKDTPIFLNANTSAFSNFTSNFTSPIWGTFCAERPSMCFELYSACNTCFDYFIYALEAKLYFDSFKAWCFTNPWLKHGFLTIRFVLWIVLQLLWFVFMLLGYVLFFIFACLAFIVTWGWFGITYAWNFLSEAYYVV